MNEIDGLGGEGMSYPHVFQVLVEDELDTDYNGCPPDANR